MPFIIVLGTRTQNIKMIFSKLSLKALLKERAKFGYGHRSMTFNILRFNVFHKLEGNVII